MKFRSFIWISAAALVILALVQYYFISETFQTKQQQFDSKYSGLAKLGLYEFENRYFDAEDIHNGMLGSHPVQICTDCYNKLKEIEKENKKVG